MKPSQEAVKKTVKKVGELREKGLTFAKIAEKLKISVQLAHWYWKKYELSRGNNFIGFSN